MSQTHLPAQIDNRVSQLCELIRAGEHGTYWEYSFSTYSNTATILYGDKKFSRFLMEWVGAKQGALKSAPDFKLYNIPLWRLINNSGLGANILETEVGLILVADDSISLADSIPRLRGLIDLYKFYSKLYKVEFAFHKTDLAVFGNKSVLHEAKNDTSLKIRNERLIFNERNEHLGLWQCSNIKETAMFNVQNRLNKTDKKMFNMMGKTLGRCYGIDTHTARTLYNVCIKPSMLAGLQALHLTNDSLALLTQYEECIMRKVFKQRELASVTPLYFFWNMEPVEVTLHKMIFSLYYGIWRDTTSPTCTISKKISDNKGLNGQY